MLQQCCITFQDGGAITFKMKNCFSKTPICELTKLNHPPTQPSSHSTPPSSPSKHHPHSLPNTTLIAFQTPPSSPSKHHPHRLSNTSLIPFQMPASFPSKHHPHRLPNNFIPFQTPPSSPFKHQPHSLPNTTPIPFQMPASFPSKHQPHPLPNTALASFQTPLPLKPHITCFIQWTVLRITGISQARKGRSPLQLRRFHLVSHKLSLGTLSN